MKKIISTDWLRPSDNIWIYQDGDLMRAVARMICLDEDDNLVIRYTGDRYINFDSRQIILDPSCLEYEYRFLHMLQDALKDDLLGDVVDEIIDAYDNHGMILPKAEVIQFGDDGATIPTTARDALDHIFRVPITIRFAKHDLKTRGIMITKDNSPYKIDEHTTCTWDGEDWFYVMKIETRSR